MQTIVRKAVHVEGIVQGVGFRPFVYGVAERLGLTGFVFNHADGVTIEVEGPDLAVAELLDALTTRPPPLARVDRVSTTNLVPLSETGFRIKESRAALHRTALISPDTATCEKCLVEIRTSSARRHRYAFTNCTNCGPRFTITKDVPYDRPKTTMAVFEMCKECGAEYHNPADRRFHAQPIACPKCGPHLKLTDPKRQELKGDPLQETARLLADGRILAIKGLGGYHLACDAKNETSVALLRSRKHREDKPFALMTAALETVRGFCEVGDKEAELLLSHRRPIVLLQRIGNDQPSPSVAPGNRNLGFMLPYTPLHHLLLDEFEKKTGGDRKTLVMTSANVSDEPIAYTDSTAYEDLKGIADFFLVHNRVIHIRCDDSVVRVFRGAEYPIRRARGYAPEPLKIAPTKLPVLGVGAELKHTFCLAKNDRAFVSHHIGDLENWETMKSFMEGVEHFARIFDIAPQVVAYDLHPEYLSTKWALEQLSGEAEPLPGLDLTAATGVGVQHHHAHIASCMADNGLEGEVIGLALDGTGWGDDKTLWGCEVLVADAASYKRVGHLKTVPLPGGAAAIKEPWRMGAVYLKEAFGDESAHLSLDFVRETGDRWAPVLEIAAAGVSSLPTSSAGRLFDAMAAIAGVRKEVNYEGQAAIELEQAADSTESTPYPCDVSGDEVLVIDGPGLISAATEALLQGVPLSKVAASFHLGLAEALVKACIQTRERTGLGRVALSGGTFQNQLLLGATVNSLEKAGFDIFWHRRVPANDGGISLGQAVVATARAAK